MENFDTPEVLLLSTAGAKNLLSSINCAFKTMITSDEFTQFSKEDRVTLVFHWELMQKYFNSVDSRL